MALHILIAATLSATAPAAKPVAPPPVVVASSNAELKAMFDADQAARAETSKVEPLDRYKADHARRRRAREIMAVGQLKTGDDFYHAAFLFQHGEKAEDFLLAHALAMAGVAEGRKDARWIAAATLDRYLQQLNQPQIFGTQFNTSLFEGTTQAPYDKAALPDSVRAIFGVPPLADQEKRRADMEAKFRARYPKP